MRAKPGKPGQWRKSMKGWGGVSRGIGSRQSAILSALYDGPLLGVDLVVRIWESDHEGMTIPYSAYESTRRAAAGLVAKGLVLVGRPMSGRHGRERARAVYWLPGQPPPELKRRTFPVAVVERELLSVLQAGPLSYPDAISRVVRRLLPAAQ
jgi:hypothetical protein